MHPHLTTLISRLPSDQLITITGATALLRNGDVHYPFRQDSDFLYLTGLSVPGLVLTIWKQSEQNPPSPLRHNSPLELRTQNLSQGVSETTEIILWREAITDLDRVWGSDKISDDEIVRIVGITDIRDVGGLEAYSETKPPLIPLSQEGSELPNPETWKSIIHSFRLIKTPDEIDKIRKAIAVSQEAFAHIEAILKP